jgi:hypothetical protein
MLERHRGFAFVGSLATIALLLAAVPSQAGTPIQSYASCTQEADGSGWCTGTPKGFRTTRDPADYYEFDLYATSPSAIDGDFEAHIGGNDYGCLTPGNSLDGSQSGEDDLLDGQVAKLWRQAVNNQGSFEIFWDVNGYCSSLYLSGGSAL